MYVFMVMFTPRGIINNLRTPFLFSKMLLAKYKVKVLAP